MNVRPIPFISLSNLSNWKLLPENEEWARNVLIPGMRDHFKSPSPILRIHDDIEFDSDTYYVDVHMELKAEDGISHQPWVLSFISRQGIDRENLLTIKRGLPELKIPTLEDLEDPFPCYDIIWECEHFTEAETVKAVKAWCEKFWPDWKPTVVFEKSVENNWLQELLSEIFLGEATDKGLDMADLRELYVFTSPNSEEFEAWLTLNYFSYILGEEGLIVWCTEKDKDKIQLNFPQSSCEYFGELPK